MSGAAGTRCRRSSLSLSHSLSFFLRARKAARRRGRVRRRHDSLDVLPFEMFDNIFVGSSAVFPNRPGPVKHKRKGGYENDKKGKRKPKPKLGRANQKTNPKGNRKEKRARVISRGGHARSESRVLVCSSLAHRRGDSTVAERTGEDTE